LDSPKTPEGAIPDELRDWLARDHDAVPVASPSEASELRCDARLVERLTTLAGPLRARRVFVAGCPVVHHPSGPPIAAAFHGQLLVRDNPPGVLASRALMSGWVLVDPWPPDVGFARGTDLLRQALARAFVAVAVAVAVAE